LQCWKIGHQSTKIPQDTIALALLATLAENNAYCASGHNLHCEKT